MVIDINRLNNASTPANSGRAGSAQAGGQNEAISNKQTPPSTPSPAEQVQQAGKSGESVQLSKDAQQLQKVSEKLRDQPAVDKERVAQLKQAIENGSYQIDSMRVAGKLLNLESQR